jgi:hypothetical protein
MSALAPGPVEVAGKAVESVDFSAHRARLAQPMQVAAPAGMMFNRSRLLNMLA